MVITIEVEHAIGDTVYLKTDPDQDGRIVLGYSIRKNELFYNLVFKADETTHYGFEISATRQY